MNNRRGLLSSAGLGTLAVCGVIVLASAGAASAADISFVPPPPVAPPPVVESPFSWTGLYAGIHLTGIRGDIDLIRTDPVSVSVLPLFMSLRGIGIGGHAGYNRQVGNLVFGFEGDFDYNWARGEVDQNPFDLDDTPLVFRSVWQASIRARVGFTAGNVLFYTTAGVAFGQGELSYDGINGLLSDTNLHIGWTAGLGTEIALNDSWAVRFETRYTDFGTRTYDLEDFQFGVIDLHWTQWTATVGVSYLFGR